MARELEQIVKMAVVKESADQADLVVIVFQPVSVGTPKKGVEEWAQYLIYF